jgi:hypothetical protein
MDVGTSTVGIYDPADYFLSSIAISLRNVHFLSFFNFSENNLPNVEVYSKAGDPIKSAESIEAAAAAKQRFLDRSDSLVIVFSLADPRSLEMVASSLRYLMENRCRKLFIVAPKQIELIFQSLPKDERDHLRRLEMTNRLVVASEINASTFQAFFHTKS